MHRKMAHHIQDKSRDKPILKPERIKILYNTLLFSI